MNNKLLLSIAATLSIAAVATTTMAAPLPAGTKLTITKTTDAPGVSSAPCSNGSCFGMFLFAGLYAWTPLGPGTDGGLIIGKGQMSGGQEVNGLSANNGELTEVWNYGGNHGTFFTAPSDAGNIFDDQSCTGSGCGSNTTPRKTDLAVWNTAWGGQTIPMGSKNGCNPTVTPACTADEIAGIFVKEWAIDQSVIPWKFKLLYDQVVPIVFPNYPFKLQLAGTIGHGDCFPVIELTPANGVTSYDTPITITIKAYSCDPGPLTCYLYAAPANGTAVVNDCTSVTYTPNFGFIGTDSFTVTAIGSNGLSGEALANVAVVAPSTPTPTYTATYTPSATALISGYPTPTVTSVQTPTPMFTPTYAPGAYLIIYPNPFVAISGVPTNYYITVIGPSCVRCSLSSSPANGVVTIDGACAGGTYTSNAGFTGADSFEILTDVCGTSIGHYYVPVTVVAPSPTPTPTIIVDGCPMTYPVSQVTLTGKQGHLSLTVSGNIVSVNSNGKEIKICPTTMATYAASTNTPGASVVCRVRSNTSRSKGGVKVSDHIKCTDKPLGNDKLAIKIKSGVNQKAQ